MRDVGYEKRGPTYLFVTNNDSPLSLLQLRGREKGGEGGRRVLGWLVGWEHAKIRVARLGLRAVCRMLKLAGTLCRACVELSKLPCGWCVEENTQE